MAILNYFCTNTISCKHQRVLLGLLLVTLVLSSCSITKNVPNDKYLLNQSTVKVEDKGENVPSLSSYVRQKPNKRILGFRFHLRMYNLANPNKYKGIHKWLKTIGEEPILLDTFLVEQSTKNIQLYLNSKGYYKALVKDTITYRRQRANVEYAVKLGTPYTVRSVKYYVEDTVLRSLVLADTSLSLVKPNGMFDTEVLQQERVRVESMLRNKGYYFLSRDYITFQADTTIGGYQVDLTLQLRNRYRRSVTGERISEKFQKYKINKVYFYPNFDPRSFNNLVRLGAIDTVYSDRIEYIFPVDPGIDLKVIDQANLIRPGDVYSTAVVEKTHSNLTSLRLYRMVNIYFEEVKRSSNEDFILFVDSQNADTARSAELNCYIQLSPQTLQSYQVELVGTNSSGNYGAEGNIIYTHKNLFKGAESFDIKFRGLFEAMENSSLSNIRSSTEFGGTVGLDLPRFLSPFSGKEFINKYSPRTRFSASYGWQRRPDYTRTVASFLFGYNWRNAGSLTHTFNPVEFNIVNLPYMSDEFKNEITGTYRENSYINQFVTVTSYSLVFNNQNIQKNKSYTYLRFNAELSGNILSGLYSQFGKKSDDGTYQIFGTSFSQYARADVNISFHQVIDESNTFVYRVFFGAGYPFGNSKALPFEKKYFSGGANGVRAWNVRALGPGSYPGDNLTYRNQTADIKLEANVEYRFKMFWVLEGALFVDAGNIWAISADDERQGALFKPNEFYKQIALGTGMGLRFNLGFLSLRFDFGLKIHDPARPSDPSQPYYEWIPFDRPYERDDWAFHFGIGYPF